jgi:hypothetical protein
MKKQVEAWKATRIPDETAKLVKGGSSFRALPNLFSLDKSASCRNTMLVSKHIFGDLLEISLDSRRRV